MSYRDDRVATSRDSLIRATYGAADMTLLMTRHLVNCREAGEGGTEADADRVVRHLETITGVLAESRSAVRGEWVSGRGQRYDPTASSVLEVVYRVAFRGLEIATAASYDHTPDGLAWRAGSLPVMQAMLRRSWAVPNLEQVGADLRLEVAEVLRSGPLDLPDDGEVAFPGPEARAIMAAIQARCDGWANMTDAQRLEALVRHPSGPPAPRLPDIRVARHPNDIRFVRQDESDPGATSDQHRDPTAPHLHSANESRGPGQLAGAPLPALPRSAERDKPQHPLVGFHCAVSDLLRLSTEHGPYADGIDEARRRTEDVATRCYIADPPAGWGVADYCDMVREACAAVVEMSHLWHGDERVRLADQLHLAVRRLLPLFLRAGATPEAEPTPGATRRTRRPRNAARDKWVAKLRAKPSPPTWPAIYRQQIEVAKLNIRSFH